jgi:hypothetical protein
MIKYLDDLKSSVLVTGAFEEVIGSDEYLTRRILLDRGSFESTRGTKYNFFTSRVVNYR